MEPNFQIFSSLRFDPVLLQSLENTAAGVNDPSHPGSPVPFYMLRYHRDRMLQAARHFQWPEAIARIDGLDGLLYLLHALGHNIDTRSTTPLRVRTLLDHNGEITVETNETPPVPLENLFPTRLPPARQPTMKVSSLTGGALTLGSDDSIQRGSQGGGPQQREPWIVTPDPVRTNPSGFTSYKTTSRDMYTEARERVGIESMTEPKEVLIISNRGDEIMEGSLTSVFFWRSGRWVTPPVTSGGQVGTTRRWLLEKGMCVEEVIRADQLIDGEECWISNGVRGLIWGRIKL